MSLNNSNFKSSVKISLAVLFLFSILFPLSINIQTVHSTNTTNGSLANLTIWDETDSGMPFAGKTRFIDDQVYFYANYTNLTSGESINGTGVYCNISYKISGTWTPEINMSFNDTELFYQHNRTFSAEENYTWNVSCNDTNEIFEELNLTDIVSVSSTNISS